MGTLKASVVHYRATGSAGSCHAFIVTDDYSGAVVDGVQVDRNLLSGLVPVSRTEVGLDDTDENGQALGTAQTWHYASNCPD